MTYYADTRFAFLAAGALLRFPAAPAAGLGAGEPAWVGWACDSGSLRRDAVLREVAPGLSRELLASDAARERFAAWVEAGRPIPTAEDVVRGLKFMGDDELRRIVLGAILEAIPAPAAWYLLRTFLFLGTGWSTGGWCARLATPAGPVLAMIALNGAGRDADHLRDLVLHEAAHGWLVEDPPGTALLPADAFANELGAVLIAAARDPELLRGILATEALQERQADALAAQWGAKHACGGEDPNAYTAKHAGELARVYGT